MFPFKQKKFGGKLIREFSNDVNSEDLVWHRDRSDRYVTVLEGKDWYIQFDNKLPIKLVEGQVYYIPAHNYHRIIKGSTNLVLEIKETSGMKITRKQLRKIILLEMQNYSLSDYSHHYPKLARLLLSHDHETLVQAIELGETLKILRKKSWGPGPYNPNYKSYRYDIFLKPDFAKYLEQNYPNPPQNLEPSLHYVYYNFPNSSISISIQTERTR